MKTILSKPAMFIKRALLVFSLSLFVSGPLLAASKHSTQAPAGVLDVKRLELASVNAVVMDVRNGRILYAKNPDAVVPIASVTKLMTALVVLDSKLPMDEVLTVTRDDIDTLKNSHSRVRIGSQLTRHEMLLLALMSSENRAASALGRHYPGGLRGFVKAMNAKARALGMNSTRFVDSTGLSANNVSTARDLAKMVKASARYSKIHELSTRSQHVARFISPRYSLGFNNTNALIRGDSPQWNIVVSKTGYIREAGRCLVMQSRLGGSEVAMVFLDSQGKTSPVGDANRVRRWIETGVGGAVPAEARAYERSKNRHRGEVVVARNASD